MGHQRQKAASGESMFPRPRADLRGVQRLEKIVKNKAFKCRDLAEDPVIAHKASSATGGRRRRLDGIGCLKPVFRTKLRSLVSNVQGHGNPVQMGIRGQQGIEFEDEIIFLLPVGLHQDLKQRERGGRCVRAAGLDITEELFTGGEIEGMPLDKIDERARIKVD